MTAITPNTPTTLAVAVDAPQHSGLAGALHYSSAQAWPPGTLLRVPLGKRELLGIVWHAGVPPATGAADAPPPVLRPVGDDTVVSGSGPFPAQDSEYVYLLMPVRLPG